MWGRDLGPAPIFVRLLMARRYELWTVARPAPAWRIVGPEVELSGALPRGYLTLPPLEIRDASGTVVARLGGDRRVAPGRHRLIGGDGSVLAVFDTHAIARVLEDRPTRVTDAGGREICSLVPAESEVAGLREKLASVIIDGGYRIVRGGEEVGRLGLVSAASPGQQIGRRLVTLTRQAVERVRGEHPEHLASVLTLDGDLTHSVAAALLLYKYSVIDPSRVPES